MDSIADVEAPIRVLSIFGTRPEAIKMFPIIHELGKHPEQITSLVCLTGQHQQMIDPLINLFKLHVDENLHIMTHGQTLESLSAALYLAIPPVLEKYQPDVVLVQGDTTSAMVAAQCAFYKRIPVGHVEAGLRTFNNYSPFPEEVNRKAISALASLNFAPTALSQSNLLQERVPPASVFVTGNPVIDAVRLIGSQPATTDAQLLVAQVQAVRTPDSTPPIHVLLTAHRRENHGQGIANICSAVLELTARFPQLHVWFPVHMNPVVSGPVHATLGNHTQVHLLAPLEYDQFVYLLKDMTIVLTDSGGIQEEVTALGKPTLVLRDTTERPEGVDAGVCKLVGVDHGTIVRETARLLEDQSYFNEMAQMKFPFGDGTSAAKIVEIIKRSDVRAMKRKYCGQE